MSVECPDRSRSFSHPDRCFSQDKLSGIWMIGVCIGKEVPVPFFRPLADAVFNWVVVKVGERGSDLLVSPFVR